ncbi:MAG: glycosyltransferase family 2 protein [Thermodesulfobacteriota bacterium]
MISICISVKNRSRVRVEGRELTLFPNCVKSIADSLNPVAECELVVSDWESDDWPLSEWLEDAASPIPVRIIKVRGSFSRGKGRNLAAGKAKGDKILFLDADMLLCSTVITNGIKYLAQGKAYFPVFLSYYGPEHQLGCWRHTSYGNCMILKSTYSQSDGWPEYYSWGLEDDHFFSNVSSFAHVVREEVAGFYHQWHPGDLHWKDRYVYKTSKFNPEPIRYVENHPLVDAELHQFRIALREVSKYVKQKETFILVDDASFLNYLNPDCYYFIPFLENNGEYWGPPPDNATAISELERLQNSGAMFIVFLWPSFWWFEYYSEFHQYLRSKYGCILQNDRLAIFDLR